MRAFLEVLNLAKEVRETTDSIEAAKLLQEGPWMIVQAAINGSDITWCLIRV